MRLAVLAVFLVEGPATAETRCASANQCREDCDAGLAGACMRLGDYLDDEDPSAAKVAWTRAEDLWRNACEHRIYQACTLAVELVRTGRLRATDAAIERAVRRLRRHFERACRKDPRACSMLPPPPEPAPVEREVLEGRWFSPPRHPDMWCGTPVI